MSTAALVIVGGAARRLHGVAKPWVSIAGRPMIDWVVDAAVRHADDVVLVGIEPAHWSRPDVRWTSEQPPGAGPVPAIAAGLAVLADDVDEVLLLAGDAPFVAAPLESLFSVAITGDAVAIRADDQLQFLCARIKRRALETALASAGTSMRSVFAGLRVTEIEGLLADADTWEDVARLRQEQTMDEWLKTVNEKLGIDPAIDIDAILDLARDVAHSLERKNAPLTSYLLGYAVAAKQLQPSQIAELAAEIGQMAKDRA